MKQTTDYNHYRTVSKTLKGTLDQAVSIMTMDVYRKLNELLPADEQNQQLIEIGDFGENITLENITYNEIEPGTILKINDVILEITRPCVPCSRLSTIKWSERAGSTWWRKKNTPLSNFINIPGARGWYAKVLQEGTCMVNTIQGAY